jgi:prolipoprotein diacylglyceryltransferase
VEAGTTDFFAVPPFQLILVVLAIVASIIVYWVMTRNTDKPGELTSGDKGA